MRSAMCLLLFGLLLPACSARVEQREPVHVTAQELALRESCVQFLTHQWPRDTALRYTRIEREHDGETLVWVNIDVADDDARLARRRAAGVTEAGNCLYHRGGAMASAHWFKLQHHPPQPGADKPVIQTALPPSFEWH